MRGTESSEEDTLPNSPSEVLHRLAKASRIAVIGPCGAGKTTLARAIASNFDRPLVQLDELYWLEEWRRPTLEVWSETVHRATAQPIWVMDGHHLSTLALRLARAELVIHLDLPTWVCLTRVLVRDVRRSLGDRNDLPDRLKGARRAGQHLAFWSHVASFRRRVRPKTVSLLRVWGGPVVTLTNTRQINALRTALATGAERAAPSESHGRRGPGIGEGNLDGPHSQRARRRNAAYLGS